MYALPNGVGHPPPRINKSACCAGVFSVKRKPANETEERNEYVSVLRRASKMSLHFLKVGAFKPGGRAYEAFPPVRMFALSY